MEHGAMEICRTMELLKRLHDKLQVITYRKVPGDNFVIVEILNHRQVIKLLSCANIVKKRLFLRITDCILRCFINL